MLHERLDLEAILTALCGPGQTAALPGILLALFAVGLFGGFAHCGPMCGPFVLMQIGDSRRDALGMRRLAVGLLPLYQLGRLTTYVALGALAGGLGATFVTLTQFRWALALLLGLAAVSFLLQGLNVATRLLPAASGALGGRVAAIVARAAGPILRGSRSSYLGGRGFLLGLVLGFLPCGFLYAALLAAAATGDPVAGGFAMAAFGLGTVPALVAVGIVGASLAGRWRRIAIVLTPAIFLLNAVTLGGLALRLAG